MEWGVRLSNTTMDGSWSDRKIINMEEKSCGDTYETLGVPSLIGWKSDDRPVTALVNATVVEDSTRVAY